MSETKKKKQDITFVSKEIAGRQGEWRLKIKTQQMKFDELAKGIFLEEYEQHGRIGDAAAKAGTTAGTVNAHRKADIDFHNACINAEEMYRSRLIGHHQNLLFEGQVKTTYDRQGNIMSEERVYPIKLIELELKKHDDGYREKRDVDVNMKVSGGVLIAPAEVSSIDDWESRFSQAKIVDAIEETISETMETIITEDDKIEVSSESEESVE